MEILDYYTLTADKQSAIRARLVQSEWRAAAYLRRLLEQNGLRALCGASIRLLLGMEGQTLAAFCTLAERDEIDDTDLTPWIGFVYTYPEFRGCRRSGALIDRACALAKAEGHEYSYISTDHVGLYEKYGFEYVTTMQTRHGDDTRVYKKRI